MNLPNSTENISEGTSEHAMAANCHEDTLYVSKFRDDEGKYLSMYANEPQSEEFLISPRIKLLISYINRKEDTTSLKLSKHKLEGGEWVDGGSLTLSSMTLARIKDFLEFITKLDLKNTTERKIRLQDHFSNLDESTKDSLKSLLNTEEGVRLINEVLSSEDIQSEDIVNLGYRKEQLKIFDKLLSSEGYIEEYKSKNPITAKGSEAAWQHFFQKNTWIFGYGLNFIFNSPLEGKKLEQIVSGNDVVSAGKRVDALLKSSGLVSSLSLVEIKTSKTSLLSGSEYRPEVWSPSSELVGGVAQTHKNVQKTIENLKSKISTKQEDGSPTGEVIYSYQPKAYLIVGSLSEFETEHGINEVKFSSFELFRKNTSSPEIITFDELYERAKRIVGYND